MLSMQAIAEMRIARLGFVDATRLALLLPADVLKLLVLPSVPIQNGIRSHIFASSIVWFSAQRFAEGQRDSSKALVPSVRERGLATDFHIRIAKSVME